MKLKFDIDEVKVLIAYTITEKKHRLTQGQLCDPDFARPGAKLNGQGFYDDESIDFSKVKPALWLIKSPKFKLVSSAIAVGVGGSMPIVFPLDDGGISGEPITLNVVNPEMDIEAIILDDEFVKAIQSTKLRSFVIEVGDMELAIGLED